MSEENLWAAVINQAIRDATSTPTTALDVHDVEKARKWLTVPNAQFEYVCELAGKDAWRIRNAVLKMLAGEGQTQESPKQFELTRKASPRQNLKSLTFDGKCQSIKQWAHDTGIPYHVLSSRVRFGWTTERALSTPVITAKNPEHSTRRWFTFRGRSQPLMAWAQELDLEYGTITARLRKGWTLEDALTTRPIPRAERYRRARPSVGDQTPGGGSDFENALGTGGGSTAQDLPETEFFQKDTSP